MDYIVIGGAPPKSVWNGSAAVLACGEMRVLEGPWPFGRTTLAWAPDGFAKEELRAQLTASPDAGAYVVAGTGAPGRGNAFVIAAHDVHDQARFRDYAARVPEVVSAFGGRFLARGGTVTCVAGCFVPERAVIIEFPTAKSAFDFYGSELYKPLLRLRLETTTPRFVVLSRAGLLSADDALCGGC